MAKTHQVPEIALSRAEWAERARSICLDQLDHAARTRSQLVNKLNREGVPADVATEVLERLAAVGLVDDAAFAAQWVQSRGAGKGLSRRRLAQELRDRGVADEVVERSTSMMDPDDERLAAQALVASRLSTTAGLAYHVRLRRLSAMLARRGFDPGFAMHLVEEQLSVAGIGPEPPRDAGEADAEPGPRAGRPLARRSGLRAGRAGQPTGERARRDG